MSYVKNLSNLLGCDIMKLKFLLQILSEFDEECDVEFDVKSIEFIEDFSTLSDVYNDGELVIIELR